MNFELFTFRENKILCNRDKFPVHIIVGIIFGTDVKIPVKFLEIIFKKNEQKHCSVIISWNFHILTKYFFIGIVINIFQMKINFPVTARDLIFY